MKILNQEQIYSVERRTVQSQGISSLELMARAAHALFESITSNLKDRSIPINLFCGTGNNGGDGLALGRLLLQAGFKIKVYVVGFSAKVSPEFKANLDALSADTLVPVFLTEDSELPEIEVNSILVDAIFGIGLNRKPDPWVCALIQHINASKTTVFSVDIPSGLPMDQLPVSMNCIVKSDAVLGIGIPKLPYFLPDFGPYIGGIKILDIGLDTGFIASLHSRYEVIDEMSVRSLYKKRLRYSHKGSYGHVRIIGGSYGKIGATMLASRASLFAGAGLITAWIPECGYFALQTGVPEVMVSQTGNTDFLNRLPEYEPSFTTVVGMGMGQHPQTQKAFLDWLPNQKSPVVLDADALNILSLNPDFLDILPENSILTPHPGELRRLIGDWQNDYEKIERTFKFSTQYRCILVIKGAFTMILSSGKAFFNPTGNPGMATGGSGDVLSGIIGGLLAQQYHPLHAALIGVYIHGRAGDISAQEIGAEALTATGIINGMGKAFKELYPLNPM